MELAWVSGGLNGHAPGSYCLKAGLEEWTPALIPDALKYKVEDNSGREADAKF